MEILDIKEQEDGSAIVEVVMTKQENDYFVEYAIVNILREKLESMTKTCFNCKAEIDFETMKEFPHSEICKDCME